MLWVVSEPALSDKVFSSVVMECVAWPLMQCVITCRRTGANKFWREPTAVTTVPAPAMLLDPRRAPATDTRAWLLSFMCGGQLLVSLPLNPNVSLP